VGHFVLVEVAEFFTNIVIPTILAFDPAGECGLFVALRF